MTAPKDRTPAPKLGLTQAEAADALGVGQDFFRRHLVSAIPCVYVGSRRIYPVQRLREWLDKNSQWPDLRR